MRQFSTEHLVVLALLAAAIAAAVARPRLIPPRALAVFIGGAYAIALGTKIVARDFDWGFDLPLHLSDVVAIFAPVALSRRTAARSPSRSCSSSACGGGFARGPWDVRSPSRSGWRRWPPPAT